MLKFFMAREIKFRSLNSRFFVFKVKKATNLRNKYGQGREA